MTYIVCEKCGFDVARIENFLRPLYKKWKSSLMTLHRQICMEHQCRIDEDERNKLVAQIKDFLTI